MGMNNMTRMLAVVAIVLLPSCSPPTRQRWWVPEYEFAHTPSPALQAKLDQPVSGCGPDIPFGDFVDFIAETTGVSISLGPSIANSKSETPIDIYLDDTPLRYALVIMAERADVGIRCDGDEIIFTDAHRR